MRRLLPVALSLFVLTACGAGGPSSAPTSPGGPSAANTSPGSPQPIREALVSADGRTVVIPGATGSCETGFAATVVTTTPDVRIRLTGHLPGGDLVCMPIALQLTKLSLVLKQPLDRRRLIDDSTGKPIPFISERVLAQPAFLPPHLSPALNLPVDGATRVYRFPANEYRAPLSINQTPWPPLPDLSKMTGTTIQHVDVNGHPAFLIDEHGRTGATYLWWTVDGYTMTVSTIPEASYQRPVSTDVILRVARGLVVPRLPSD